MAMREVIDREGRDAKNLVVYQFCEEPASFNKMNSEKPEHRKPPKSPNSLNTTNTPKKARSPARMSSNKSCTSGPRVRSASTDRDKRSELQARYWALLFGNLQRAVNEIYQTVECYENISSCQEAILVLENYVRDFKALSEWFKVSWDYDSRPIQQRPQSLAWEVRKSNPVPRVRAKSLSSPSPTSGKSSPLQCHLSSGKSSPACVRYNDALTKCAMRVSVRELFSSTNKQQQQQAQLLDQQKKSNANECIENICRIKQKEEDEPMLFPNRQNQYAQTDLEDDHLTLADVREKLYQEEQARLLAGNESKNDLAEPATIAESFGAEPCNSIVIDSIKELTAEPTAVEMTIQKLNAMEDALLKADANKPATPETKFLKQIESAILPIPVENVEVLETMSNGANDIATVVSSPLTAEETPTTVIEIVSNNLQTLVDNSKKFSTTTIQQNGPLKYSSVLNRPATRSNTATKLPNTTTTITGNISSSVRAAAVTTKSNISAKHGITTSSNYNKRGAQQVNTNRTTRVPPTATSRANNTQNIPPRPSSKTETYAYGPPTHVASRLTTRSRTMIEMNGKAGIKRVTDSRIQNSFESRTNRHKNSSTSSRKSSREDIGSSTSTLKASNERIGNSRNNQTNDERHSEPKQMPSEINDDGWLTVKNRRRSSMHWLNRFNQPTGYASLPTLSLLNVKKSETNDNSVEEQQQTTSTQKQQPSKKSEKTVPVKANTKNNSNEKTSNITTTTTKPQRKQSATPTSTPTPTATTTTNNNIRKSTKLSRPEIKNAKAKVNSLPPQRKNSMAEKRNGKTESNPSAKAKTTFISTRSTTIKRQKSDITGLKMTSLHEEYMRSEQNSYERKNQAMSALALATERNESRDNSMGASSTETIIAKNEIDDIENQACGDCGEQNKIDIKIQTNRDFSKTIGDLYESIATMSKSRFFMIGDAADKNSVKQENRLPCCEEDEDELDVTLTNEMLDCDEHQRLLDEEQESLERQIRELESTEIDVDTETDETDCEVALDQEENEDDINISKLDLHPNHLEEEPAAVVFVSINEEDARNVAINSNENDASSMSLETRYHALLSEMSWGEREEALATLEAYVARHPGRAQELHQKLSSPSRRRSLQETLKKYQAKQTRAQEKREFLQKEKAIKIQQLLTRVEDVKSARLQIIKNKRQKMEDRLQRAAENREQYLRQIIEKAHDEEKKLKEINFIKYIEAQNKRLDLIESSKDAEGRLTCIEQERLKRLEEKAAKEAAVEKRRQELELERQRKLEKMNESRLEREIRIGKMQEQKERQRQALAAEKARDREERMLALQAQHQQTTEELQRKIQQKQQESARRHEENIEHIRQRALELTIPSRNQDENANCDLASCTDGEHSSSLSESSTREHSRNFKKKLKKIKQRMAQSAEEYLSKEQQPVPVYMKRDSQVPKFLNLITKGGGSQGIERALLQLMRLISKAQVIDFQCFLVMDGLGIVNQHVILKSMEEDSEISKKALVLAVQLYRNACSVCPQISRHALLGNSVAGLFDLLTHSLQIELPEEKSPQHPVELSTELMLACTVVLSPCYGKKHTHPKTLERLPDLISYAVITGLIETLARRCMKIRESVENQKSVILSLLATLGLLTKFIDVCQPGPNDPTRLLHTAKSTDLFGAISMLYASVMPMGECIPPRTVSLAAATFNLLVSMAVLDLSTFQDTLTTESLALKYLDVITILLKYCGTKEKILKNAETQAMIIDLIASIGFYCANNRKHQDLLTSEQCSIIIKSLTKLPEQFQVVVYPCLVTITFQNQNARNVIARDFNLDYLDEYHKSDKGKKNHLVSLLKT